MNGIYDNMLKEQNGLTVTCEALFIPRGWAGAGAYRNVKSLVINFII